MNDDPHLTEHELAARWRISVRTLQRMRSKGRVPPHLIVARRVLYPLDELKSYEADHLRGSEAAP